MGGYLIFRVVRNGSVSGTQKALKEFIEILKNFKDLEDNGYDNVPDTSEKEYLFDFYNNTDFTSIVKLLPNDMTMEVHKCYMHS